MVVEERLHSFCKVAETWKKIVIVRRQIRERKGPGFFKLLPRFLEKSSFYLQTGRCNMKVFKGT